MPFEHLRYPRPGFLDGIVHTSAQFHLDGPKFGSHALLDCLAPDDETSGLPRLRAEVRKAEKVERLGFPQPQPLAFFDRVATKADQPGLSRVQGQVELAHPFLQILQKLLRLSFMLEADQHIIRIADDDHVACRLLAPGMGP